MDADFQSRVMAWLRQAFSIDVVISRKQRSQRFLEEALELVQACGLMTDAECHDMVNHVFSRPKGRAMQEVGGVVITLSALCSNEGFSMKACGEIELERIQNNIDKVRAKQQAKPENISDHRDTRMSLSMKDVRIDEAPRDTIPPLRSSKA